MLYHRRRPCANPAPGVMVNKQLAMRSSLIGSD
jgi:hypothetical protein